MAQTHGTRRILYLFALLWELFRTGMLWKMNSPLLIGVYDPHSMFYLLYLISPVLALFAGYLIILIEPQRRSICLLVTMGRGFEFSIGMVSSLILWTTNHPGPMVPHRILLLLIIIGDAMLLLFQLLDIRERRH